MSPPSSYRSPSWMSYPPEPEDLPRQWNDTPVRHIQLLYDDLQINTWQAANTFSNSVFFSACKAVFVSSPCRTRVILKPSAEVICPWHWVETARSLVGHNILALFCDVLFFHLLIERGIVIWPSICPLSYSFFKATAESVLLSDAAGCGNCVEFYVLIKNTATKHISQNICRTKHYKLRLIQYQIITTQSSWLIEFTIAILSV